MKQFTIDINYCTSVTIHKEFELHFDSEEDKIIFALKYGSTKATSTSSEDHPEFKKLREQLGSEGYVSIERGWWNGDTVLKPFKLNNKIFKKRDQFPSGAAIRWVLEH